jgi:small-conductance mechanosensitive channel
VKRLATSLGLGWPTYHDVVSTSAALALTALAFAVAWLAGRTLGPHLAAFWARRAGTSDAGLEPRMCRLVRYLVAAILLAIILKADAWPRIPSFILGLALAGTAALFVHGIARGLHIARWLASLAAFVTFLALLADAVGGLAEISRTLDQVGFSAGERRFSLLTLFQICAILIGLYAVVKLLNRVIGHAIHRTTGLDATQRLLAQKLAGVALLVAAFFLGIDLIGIDLTALAVFSGAFGLAIGFGLQKTFGNLIAGIILLMDRSIKPGDVIVVGESFGHVTKIGVRAVSIVTRDGKEHLIPNENLMTQEVENWSFSSPNVRVHIPVGVAYDCDLKLAQQLMIEAATHPDRVLKEPRPSVWLRSFGENAVEHDILVWIADPQAGVGGVQSQILSRLWELFKENDIAIPFPQRDLRIKEWPEPPPATSN